MGSSKHEEDPYPELFPDDYGQRLERLLALADISWEQFADFLGVEYDLVMEWREGPIPTVSLPVARTQLFPSLPVADHRRSDEPVGWDSDV